MNDYELLYLVSENNEDAYNLIVEKYGPLIDKMARKYERTYKEFCIEHEELVQEGKIGLLNAIKSYSDTESCIFYTFANLVVRREMERYIKKCLRNKNLVLTLSKSLEEEIGVDDLVLGDFISSPNDEVETNFFSNSLEDLVYNFKYELNDVHSQIYELRINNFSNKEISELLDIKYKIIDNAVRQMKSKLKKYIQSYL